MLRSIDCMHWDGKTVRPHNSQPFRTFSTDGDGKTKPETPGGVGGGYNDEKYPSGEFVFRQRNSRENFVVKTRLLFAWPWERFERGSVLQMILRGEISDQLKRFSKSLSLPKICENFEKAAYDPRVEGIYLHIDSLNCGWGKLEEIRRHISDFKKSGKFIIGYMPAWGVKEYYIASACDELYAPPSAYVGLYGLLAQASFLGGVLEKVGIEAQVERIGKYKSAGDQLTRKSMSTENREMLTTLLDNIYGNWLDKISLAKGKKKEDIEKFINEGVYQVEKMKEEGLITDVKYDDEVISMLRTRLGISSTKILPTVGYRKYCNVRRSTLGLTGGKDQIAIIRACGSISRTQGRFKTPNSGIVAEQFIEKIRSVRGKINLGKLYENIGFNKEIISRGKYAELVAADHRSFRADEAELFAKRAQDMYKGFVEKAAISRSMTVEKMEQAAQGRVWSGHDAVSLGLVDAIGGLSRAVAIAKQKANIPLDEQVTLVELSRSSTYPLEILMNMGNSVVEADEAVKELIHEMGSSNVVQARMEGVLFEKMDGSPNAKSIFAFIKQYLRSL